MAAVLWDLQFMHYLEQLCVVGSDAAVTDTLLRQILPVLLIMNEKFAP